MSVYRAMINYQEIVENYIGSFGFSQFMIIIGMGLPKIVISWAMIMIGFTSKTPDWWSVAYNNTGNISVPINSYKVCPKSPNETLVFSNSLRTIITEWSLVCDLDWVSSTIATVQMSGVLVGGALGGQLGDILGRRKCVITLYVVMLVAVLGQGLSPSWQVMIVCCFFAGIGIGGFMVVINVFILEFVGIKHRTITIVTPFWGIGVMLFGPLVLAVPYWRHVSYAIAGIGSLCLPLMWIYLPESARWLLTRKKFDEGEKVLRTLAKRNKRSNLEDSELTLRKCIETEFNNPSNQPPFYTYFSLFTHSYVRWRVLLLSFVWFTCSFIYYALTLGVGNLSGDVTVNFVLMGVGETLQSALVWLLSLCLGRRSSTAIFLFATAVSSFGITISYFTASATSFPTFLQVLAIISRTMLVCAWASAAMSTLEGVPTVIRALAYGFVSVVARVGGIVAPQNKNLGRISAHLPFTVNGALALLSGVLCLLLTETIDARLDDFIQEDENRVQKDPEARQLKDEITDSSIL